MAPDRDPSGRLQRKFAAIATGDSGNRFELCSRLSLKNENDFSVILRYAPRNGEAYRLLRYDGAYGEHKNKFEGVRLPRHCCHIHAITERYQEAEYDEDGFAEVTTKYIDFEQAVRTFLADVNCYFRTRDKKQIELFPEDDR